MALNSTAILDAAVSHALRIGQFERVAQHEFKAAPGAGVSCEAWAQRIRPIPGRSGLAATSARIAFTVRARIPMLRQPMDAIDPELMAVADALMDAYTGDFDLGGAAAEVDLLGMHGDGLEANAGYLNQDGKLYRVMDINLPVIVNDAWVQAA